MEMYDADKNRIYSGIRVAAADNVGGITMRLGKVIGFTDQRVKVKWDDGSKPSAKNPHALVKIFNQER